LEIVIGLHYAIKRLAHSTFFLLWQKFLDLENLWLMLKRGIFLDIGLMSI